MPSEGTQSLCHWSSPLSSKGPGPSENEINACEWQQFMPEGIVCLMAVLTSHLSSFCVLSFYSSEFEVSWRNFTGRFLPANPLLCLVWYCLPACLPACLLPSFLPPLLVHLQEEQDCSLTASPTSPSSSISRLPGAEPLFSLRSEEG